MEGGQGRTRNTRDKEDKGAEGTWRGAFRAASLPRNPPGLGGREEMMAAGPIRLRIVNDVAWNSTHRALEVSLLTTDMPEMSGFARHVCGRLGAGGGNSQAFKYDCMRAWRLLQQNYEYAPIVSQGKIDSDPTSDHDFNGCTCGVDGGPRAVWSASPASVSSTSASYKRGTDRVTAM